MRCVRYLRRGPRPRFALIGFHLGLGLALAGGVAEALISRVPIDRKFPIGFCPWEVVIPFTAPTDSVTIRFAALRTDSLGIDNIFLVESAVYFANDGTCPLCPNFDLDGTLIPVQGFLFDTVNPAQIQFGETFGTNPSARGWNMTRGATFDPSLSAPMNPSSGTSTFGPGFVRLTGSGGCLSDTVQTSVRVATQPGQSYVLNGWTWSQRRGTLIVTIDTDPQYDPLDTPPTLVQPDVIRLVDRPADQGGFVDLHFRASTMDQPGSPEIGSYQVQYSAPGPSWTTAATIPATRACTYFATVPCPVDSIAGQPTSPASLRVVAVRTSDGMQFASTSRSIFSIDNMTPTAPQLFYWQYAGPPDPQGDRPVLLGWSWLVGPSTPPDIASVRLYRTDDVFVTPPVNSHFIQVPSGLNGSFEDADASAAMPYYFVRAIDVHGNISGALSAVEGAPVDVEPGALHSVLWVGTPRPNPATTGARIEFSLPHAAGVRMECFDVRGRLLHESAAESLPAGRHSWELPTVDRNGATIPPGLQFVRIRSGERTEVRRWVTR